MADEQIREEASAGAGGYEPPAVRSLGSVDTVTSVDDLTSITTTGSPG
jgi:hypothetical protein